MIDTISDCLYNLLGRYRWIYGIEEYWGTGIKERYQVIYPLNL